MTKQEDEKETSERGEGWRTVDKTDGVIMPRTKDLRTSYLFYRNYAYRNPYEEYFSLKKCVQIGKELMPHDLDLDEIHEIYIEACEILAKSHPDKKEITFSNSEIGGEFNKMVYCIKADDAGSAYALDEQLQEILQDFNYQQYEQLLPALQGIDDKIFRILVREKVLLKKQITIDDLIGKELERYYDVEADL